MSTSTTASASAAATTTTTTSNPTTVHTIELPFGDGVARCTIEIPVALAKPPEDQTVINFTYDVVAWVVKIATEMTIRPSCSIADTSIEPRQA
jgi:hypothetical protein